MTAGGGGAAAGGLFPAFDVPSALAEGAAPARGAYPRAPLWDLEAGDFALDGARRTLYGSGHDAWALWCAKAILTQRWACGGYSGNAGIEGEEAFAEPDREAAESALERTVTEALLADPLGRTEAVRDFAFEWRGDSLAISCTAIGGGGSAAAVNAELRA